MGTGAITAYFDVAQLVLYMFWIFFFGLIYYLIRENHREGYPMEHADSDNTPIEGWPRAPEPKSYLLEGGRELKIPRSDPGNPPLNAEPVYKTAHAPLEPTGDPMTAGVGPGSWSTLRPDEVDLDHHGEPKIVPLALAPECGVSTRDTDPRGLPLLDTRGDVAGTIRDLWIDRGEMQFRYLEAEVPLAAGGSRRVLVPMPFASVAAKGVTVDALYAHQFAAVPSTRATDRLTLLEEERITACYGAGTLYADPSRAESLI